MIEKESVIRIIIMLVLFLGCTSKKSDFPVLKGPYLGQIPPGITPELFAPGIISTGMSESSIAVSPDGNEIFYSVHAGNSETIITTRLKEGCWTQPEVAPFSGKYLDGFPTYHPDDSKLYFHSYRPLDDSTQIADVVNIWFVDREGEGWGNPKPIGPPINGNGFVCCPSVTNTGTLYYSKKTKDGGEKIFRSRYMDGKYMEPEELPQIVNKRKAQFHAVISPDESFLIMPYEDYFVSFRDEKDNWTDLIDIGDAVNKLITGGCPSISSDGKYFFFAAYPAVKWNKYFDEQKTYSDLQKITLEGPAYDRTDIFWVDIKIIDQLKEK